MRRQAPGRKMDFITGLDRSEKIFQTRMMDIFQKFNRPFVDDIVVNIGNLTYETPDGGQRSWIHETDVPGYWKFSFVTKRQDLRPVRESLSSDLPEERSLRRSKKKKLSTTFQDEHFSGQSCSTLMQYKEDPFVDDCKGFVPTQYSDLSGIGKTIQVSEQLKRLIERITAPSRNTVAVCQAGDSEPSDNGEASYSEPGNKTLSDFYPEMIENLGRLWNLPFKNQTADRIVRHYKRHIFYKNRKIMLNKKMSTSFNKTYTICPAPNVEKILTSSETNKFTLMQKESGSGEHSKISSPRLRLFSEPHKLDSPVVPFTHRSDSQNNASKTFECTLADGTMYMDRPFPAQKEINDMSPGYNLRVTISPYKMYNSSTKGITNKSQMDMDIDRFPYFRESRHLQQNFQTPSRRNSFSGFPILQSPKEMVVEPNCSMSERTRSPRTAMTTPSRTEVNERNRQLYKEYIKQLPNRTCCLTRRNSFSAFTEDQSPNRNLESLYESLTQAGFSIGKAQVQLSATVSSLVNSPGSIRAKRPLSNDFLFSLSKKPRVITEAVIVSTSKSSFCSMDRSDRLRSETSSSNLQHSVVASALPTHMLPLSPVSSRSFSPVANGGSPRRRNAWHLLENEFTKKTMLETK
ncbi:Holliday junction recognition protein isoform X2 [Rhinoderma darwinii]|uniref:Holliday junction recognition protein isoform X2 n=1 Tax=Rhinoderma darwinii TaxID=43563 RepID=UPI003F67A5DC